MNAVDIAIVVVMAVGVIAGLVRGLVRGLFGLAGLALGILIAARGYSAAADSVFSFVPGENGPEVVSFVVLFVLVLCFVAWIGRLLSRVVKFASLGWLDHLAGAGLGFVKACAVIALVLFVTVLLGLENSRALAESEMAPLAFRVTDGIVALIPEDARERLEDSYKRLRDRWERRRSGRRADVVWSVQEERAVA